MTNHQIDLQAIDAKIQVIRGAAEELKAMGDEFPALTRNLVRLMASTKMLELEVSDLTDL